MAQIFIARMIPDAAIRPLKKAGHHVEVWDSPVPMSAEELQAAAQYKDVLISTPTEQITTSFFNAVEHVRLVANYGTHYDNLDIGAASKKGVALTYTPKVYVESAAEFTIGLIVAITRHIKQANTFFLEGQFKCWDPFLFRGMELRGKTLGLIGFGVVGQRVAHIAHHGFGMHILYNDYEQVANTAHAEFVDLEELCSSADVITIHLPNRPSTKKLVNAELLRKMKSGVFIVNASRGAVVDEAALVQSIRGGHVAAAALDVLSCEGIHTCEVDDYAELKKLPQVLLTPHIATSTHEARNAMAHMVAESVLAFLDGKIPQGLLNPEIFE